MRLLLLIVALVCAFISLLVAAAVVTGSTTWQEWVSGSLLAYLAPLLAPAGWPGPGARP